MGKLRNAIRNVTYFLGISTWLGLGTITLASVGKCSDELQKEQCQEICSAQGQKDDARLPNPQKNQTLIVHPDYLQSYKSLGYTLLTDIDFDGKWDIADRVHVGFTPGDVSHKLFYKKGFGPAQSVDARVEIVEQDFFEPYR